ncbi:MAG: hypothetical protein N2378_08690 [Chloroflexaceae bacterium]|nr:hypothetical protein [Chloroflexaceae bacterium]
MLRWIGIGLGVLLLLLIAAVVGLYLAPVGVREATRDIFIIILGFFTLVSTILTIAIFFGLLYVLNRLDRLARLSLMPKLDELSVKLNDVLDSTRTLAANAKDTAGTVVGTTGFVSERVVSPIIRVSSLVTGVAAAATTFARRDAPERFNSES